MKKVYFNKIAIDAISAFGYPASQADAIAVMIAAMHFIFAPRKNREWI